MYCKLKNLPVGTAFRYLQTNWIMSKHCKKLKYINAIHVDNHGKSHEVEFEGDGGPAYTLPSDPISGNRFYYGYNATVTLLRRNDSCG